MDGDLRASQLTEGMLKKYLVSFQEYSLILKGLEQIENSHRSMELSLVPYRRRNGQDDLVKLLRKSRSPSLYHLLFPFQGCLSTGDLLPC